ncbi:MAG TPA: hypothetical protein RMH99_04195 [Sandaracinaceae bacterium LLY-WYZ-13_1]|nr:hypothetical protein [Sandaracinaceae bacterium LLY-WYZ-13_1]
MRGVVIAIVVVVALLAVITYAALFFPSTRGYGYAGYGGYHHGPSAFYWGGTQTYHSRSVRAGSRSGPGVRSGGIHGGK